MPKRNGSGAKSNPGKVRTGISRSVLLALEPGPSTIDEVLSRLGPHSAGVSHGTIWTTLERAIRYGLIQKTNEKRPHLYGLTEGGSRRVKWIKGQFKRKVRPVAEGRAVANPPIEKEEE